MKRSTRLHSAFSNSKRLSMWSPSPSQALKASARIRQNAQGVFIMGKFCQHDARRRKKRRLRLETADARYAR